jgi:hypothetical protein
VNSRGANLAAENSLHAAALGNLLREFEGANLAAE